MAEVGSYCTHCGTKIETSSKFCPNCGRSTSLATSGEGARIVKDIGGLISLHGKQTPSSTILEDGKSVKPLPTNKALADHFIK